MSSIYKRLDDVLFRLTRLQVLVEHLPYVLCENPYTTKAQILQPLDWARDQLSRAKKELREVIRLLEALQLLETAKKEGRTGDAYKALVKLGLVPEA
jgi:hypothetical protein